MTVTSGSAASAGVTGSGSAVAAAGGGVVAAGGVGAGGVVAAGACVVCAAAGETIAIITATANTLRISATDIIAPSNVKSLMSLIVLFAKCQQ